MRRMEARRRAIAGEIFEILGQAAAAVEPSRCNGVSTGNAESRQKPLYRHRARDDTELVLDLLSLSKDGDHRGYPQRKRELQLQGFSFVTVS